MEIRKEFKFEAAHRLVSSYSKDCQNIHGHSYVVELFLKGENLNCDAMVMDFGEVKRDFAGLIDSWDHSLILAGFDPMLEEMQPILDKWAMKYHIVNFNPTAEMMARFFLNYAVTCNLPASRVRVHETRTGWAECTL